MRDRLVTLDSLIEQSEVRKSEHAIRIKELEALNAQKDVRIKELEAQGAQKEAPRLTDLVAEVTRQAAAIAEQQQRIDAAVTADTKNLEAWHRREKELKTEAFNAREELCLQKDARIDALGLEVAQYKDRIKKLEEEHVLAQREANVVHVAEIGHQKRSADSAVQAAVAKERRTQQEERGRIEGELVVAQSKLHVLEASLMSLNKSLIETTIKLAVTQDALARFQ